MQSQGSLKVEEELFREGDVTEEGKFRLCDLRRTLSALDGFEDGGKGP